MTEPPIAIRARQAEQLLELQWEGEEPARIPYRDVRAECPCASCKDEWSGQRILDPSTIPADLTLEGMEAVGNYAVRILWSDGHGSGIFTWDALRNLARASGQARWMGVDPPPPKR